MQSLAGSIVPMTQPMKQTLPAQLPQHVAIIMDGNNRYARKQSLPRGDGHRAGKDQLDPLVEHARRLGLRALTVFAFSSENWQRPAAEVSLLMDLFAQTIKEQLPRMKKHDIAMRFIGDRSRMSPQLQTLMNEAEQLTAHHDAMSLVIAVSYGGQWDMAQAARRMAEAVQRGELRTDQINENTMQLYVEMADLPPVDLLIRTGGDYRLSNFVLWQAAYAELYFTETLWPEFAEAEFDHALALFAGRERRFGLTTEQINSPVSAQSLENSSHV